MSLSSRIVPVAGLGGTMVAPEAADKVRVEVLALVLVLHVSVAWTMKGFERTSSGGGMEKDRVSVLVM